MSESTVHYGDVLFAEDGTVKLHKLTCAGWLAVCGYEHIGVRLGQP